MSEQQKPFNKRLRLLLWVLVLAAVSFMGTAVAAYMKEARLFPSGWVGPKYYAFEVESAGGHNSLAPGESTVYNFNVKNHNAGGVAQVPLKVLVQATYPAQLAGTGRVQAQLKCGSEVLGTSDSGTLEAAGAALPGGVQSTHGYSLTLTWLDADMVLLGDVKDTAFPSSAVTIKVSGYQ